MSTDDEQTPVDARLADLTAYALGALDEEETSEVERALASSEELRRELEEIEEALAGAADALEPVTPAPGARAALLEALEGPERYAPFVPRLAETFDLAIEKMRDALRRALATPEWTETGVPGVSFVHFEAGPAFAGIDTGFVRFEAGAAFPPHRHHGRELTFVLEGELAFDDARVLRPGDAVVLGPDDGLHAVRAGDAPVVYATFHEGFTIEPLDD